MFNRLANKVTKIKKQSTKYQKDLMNGIAEVKNSFRDNFLELRESGIHGLKEFVTDEFREVKNETLNSIPNVKGAVDKGRELSKSAKDQIKSVKEHEAIEVKDCKKMNGLNNINSEKIAADLKEKFQKGVVKIKKDYGIYNHQIQGYNMKQLLMTANHSELKKVMQILDINLDNALEHLDRIEKVFQDEKVKAEFLQYVLYFFMAEGQGITTQQDQLGLLDDWVEPLFDEFVDSITVKDIDQIVAKLSHEKFPEQYRNEILIKLMKKDFEEKHKDQGISNQRTDDSDSSICQEKQPPKGVFFLKLMLALQQKKQLMIPVDECKEACKVAKKAIKRWTASDVANNSELIVDIYQTEIFKESIIQLVNRISKDIAKDERDKVILAFAAKRYALDDPIVQNLFRSWIDSGKDRQECITQLKEYELDLSILQKLFPNAIKRGENRNLKSTVAEIKENELHTKFPKLVASFLEQYQPYYSIDGLTLKDACEVAKELGGHFDHFVKKELQGFKDDKDGQGVYNAAIDYPEVMSRFSLEDFVKYWSFEQVLDLVIKTTTNDNDYLLHRKLGENFDSGRIEDYQHLISTLQGKSEVKRRLNDYLYQLFKNQLYQAQDFTLNANNLDRYIKHRMMWDKEFKPIKIGETYDKKRKFFGQTNPYLHGVTFTETIDELEKSVQQNSSGKNEIQPSTFLDGLKELDLKNPPPNVNNGSELSRVKNYRFTTENFHKHFLQQKCPLVDALKLNSIDFKKLSQETLNTLKADYKKLVHSLDKLNQGIQEVSKSRKYITEKTKGQVITMILNNKLTQKGNSSANNSKDAVNNLNDEQLTKAVTEILIENEGGTNLSEYIGRIEKWCQWIFKVGLGNIAYLPVAGIKVIAKQCGYDCKVSFFKPETKSKQLVKQEASKIVATAG